MLVVFGLKTKPLLLFNRILKCKIQNIEIGIQLKNTVLPDHSSQLESG